MAEPPAHEPDDDRPASRIEPDVRFSLANERTLLAYQRTAIGLMAAAIAVVHFLGEDDLVVALAGMLLLTAMVAAVGGYVQFRRVEIAIREDRPVGNGPAAHTLSVALLLCLVFATAYLILRE